MIRTIAFLTLPLSAIMMYGGTPGTTTNRHNPKGQAPIADQTILQKIKKDNGRPESLRLPTVITGYEWVNGAWDVENATIEKYSYNEDGSVATRIWGEERTEYSYDELGRESGYKVFDIDDGVLKYDIEYRYDPIVKDFITAVIQKYDDSEVCSGTEIIRNEDGHVTKIVRYTEIDGEKSYDWEYILIEYGQDGKAVSITKGYEYPGEEGMWEYGVSWQLKDIAWDSTDGQILFEDMDLYYPFSKWYFGNNRIASAVLNDNERAAPVYISVEYGNNAYISRFTMNDESIGEITFQSPDDSDSYHYESNMQRDYYDEEWNPVSATTTSTSTCLCDDFGLTLQLDNESIFKSGSEEEIESYHYKGHITYDSFGYPIEVLGTELSEETGEYVNSYLTIFSDYVECSADVKNMEHDTDTKPEYFNLQGIRVDNPSKGIYILRQGAIRKKVAL